MALGLPSSGRPWRYTNSNDLYSNCHFERRQHLSQNSAKTVKLRPRLWTLHQRRGRQDGHISDSIGSSQAGWSNKITRFNWPQSFASLHTRTPSCFHAYFSKHAALDALPHVWVDHINVFQKVLCKQFFAPSLEELVMVCLSRVQSCVANLYQRWHPSFNFFQGVDSRRRDRKASFWVSVIK